VAKFAAKRENSQKSRAGGGQGLCKELGGPLHPVEKAVEDCSIKKVYGWGWDRGIGDAVHMGCWHAGPEAPGQRLLAWI
jgi:hypothetical protein